MADYKNELAAITGADERTVGDLDLIARLYGLRVNDDDAERVMAGSRGRAWIVGKSGFICANCGADVVHALDSEPDDDCFIPADGVTDGYDMFDLRLNAAGRAMEAEREQIRMEGA